MLLDHFDNNPNFLRERNQIVIEFQKKGVTLMLATKQGMLPIDDDHMLGSWRLSPKHDLTVSMVLKHGAILFNSCQKYLNL